MCSYKDLANAIRILSIDAVQQANSGHPGAPMGMADISEVLWRCFLNHNPNNPNWFNRDRFILSNGHCSMLLYSLLHLSGYNISIEDIKSFRQINSKTPGHPEFYHTVGIEATTGPLGQGLANAVGFAISERTLSSQFNRKNFNIIDHYTYVFVGDGCLMEGISHEVSSLAGTLKLDKLIVFYDNNGISIDGKVKNWFTDDTKNRFISYKWNVIDNINGHDRIEIKKAISQAKTTIGKPSLLICNTIIGFGSINKSGSHESHGAPLGKEEISLVRKNLNWEYPPFFIPELIYKKWNAKKNGQIKENIWNKCFLEYCKKYPELSEELKKRILHKLPNNWKEKNKKFLKNLNDNPKNISTRQASQNNIEFFGKLMPQYLIGGSADLTPSNLTTWSGSKSINNISSGNYIHYGVREFGMTAIANGISLHGGFLPYTSTFLVFVDYARNAVRMAALMKIRHIMIYTHDSIGLGEDGPTHQPIEQLSSLRIIPNMTVWRPCDQIECAISWKYAIEAQSPVALILSRQNLIQQIRDYQQIKNIKRGAYILKDSSISNPDIILIATGSEVNIACNAYFKLVSEGYKVRLVSMPSTNIFDKQEKSYREFVLPKSIKNRIAIEAGITDYWYKYVGLQGKIIGMKDFGISGPADKLFNFFGFNVSNIVSQAKKLI